MRVVHLGRDEKFLPLMRSLFEEAFPGCNRWIVARKRREKQRFVAAADDVVFRDPLRFRLGLVARDVVDADCLVAHSMTTIFAKALRQARPDCLVVWIGWGYDYYPLLESQLGPLTLEGTRALASGAGKEEGERRPLLGLWRKTPALVAAAARIDVCCVLPTELGMLRAAVPGLHARFHELPLFTVEDVFDRGPPAMDGQDVLLGNSATASNNHLEALEMLRGRLPDGARVVAPLSYGDAEYGRRVAQAGRRLLGERFEALTGWMPLDAYNERIRSCGFVVMNHRRQQAVGNIGAALYKGATVYLRPENPLYGFYRGLGVTLRPMDDLGPGAGPLVPLTPAERAANREAIDRHYRRARVVESIRRLADYRHARARGT